MKRLPALLSRMRAVLPLDGGALIKHVVPDLGALRREAAAQAS